MFTGDAKSNVRIEAYSFPKLLNILGRLGAETR